MNKNMKKIFFGILFISFIGFAQEVSYEIRGKYAKSVKKETLEKANYLKDFIPYYPSSWVNNYISVEVLAVENGITHSATGQNETLNEDQKNILSKLDLGSEIEVNVKYNTSNSVTEQMEQRKIKILMTVVPEIEAEYLGGYPKLKQYLKFSLIDKVIKHTPAENQKGKVSFIVNENGEIIDSVISLSSGNAETDHLLLEIIDKMPKWNPAKNGFGKPVKQKFEFSMGVGGC